MTSLFAYTTGGTLAPDAPSYVERQADKDLLSNLEAGETCYVLNSRQMGKSSLCVRTIGRLREAGVRTAFCDLTKFGGRNLTAEQWYAALVSEIGRDLNLRSEFLGYWKENAGLPPVQRLFGAITEFGLTADSPVVVFFDEIDVTLSLPFSADEFFAAIRQCYVGRATDEKLKRLSFCLLGTATPADLIQDTRVSPFNIGKRVELSDFTEQEAAPLASGLGETSLLNRVLHWTGGHPYLTQRLCQAVRDSESKDVDRVCSDLFLTHAAKESDDNLAFVRNRLLKSEADLPALLDMYRKMRSGKSVPDDETNPLCAILKLSGVAKVEVGNLKVRNRIYGHVFDQDWVESHMPDAEKRRQKEAYRKGLFRSAALGGVVAATLAVFAFTSWQARKVSEIAQKTTEATRKNLDYQLYVSKMNNVQLYIEEGNSSQMSQALEETKNSPYGGWEWGYWNGLLHAAKEEYVLDGPNRSAVQAASLSENGRQIMISDEHLQVAALIDRATKNVIAKYPLNKGESVVRRGSRWFAYNYIESGLSIRDLITGQLKFRTKFLKGKTRTAILSAAGILTNEYSEGAAFGSSISRLLDFDTGRTLWESPATRIIQTALETTSNGQRILLYKFDGMSQGNRFTTAVVDRRSRILDQFSDQKPSPVGSLSPSGRYWAYGKNGRITVRDLEKHLTVLEFEGTKSSEFVYAYFDPSESKLVCTTNNSHVQVFSLDSGKLLADYGNAEVSPSPPTSEEMILAGETVRVVPFLQQKISNRRGQVRHGSDDRLAFQKSFPPTLELATNPGLVSTCKVTSQNSILSSQNGRVYATFEKSKVASKSVLRETETGRVLQESAQGWRSVEAADNQDIYVTLSLDRTEIAAFRFSESTALWKKTLNPSTFEPKLCISVDGKVLLLDTPEASTEVIEPLTGRVIKLVGRASWQGYSTFIGKDGDYYIPEFNSITIFDGQSHTIKQKLLLGLSQTVVDMSPDGTRMLTGDTAGGITVWDPRTGKRLCRIQACANNAVYAAVFTADGKSILTSETDDSVSVWNSDDTDRVIRIPVDSPKAPVQPPAK